MKTSGLAPTPKHTSGHLSSPPLGGTSGEGRLEIPFLFISILLFLSTDKWHFTSAAHAEVNTPPVVSVIKVEPIKLADEITYPARVVSKVNAAINADVDGIILNILAPLGRQVARGTPLFTIKNTDPVYEYVPVKTLAPIAGVISAVDVAEGSMVKRGQQLATITDPRQTRISVEIAASDLTKVQSGLEGKFGTNERDQISVKIAGVSPLVDPATGTAAAELTIDPKAPRLPVGLIGRVTFDVNRRQGLQVPEQALVYRGSDTFLRLVNGAKAKLVPVRIAATRRGMSEIATGLSPGDTVIVRSSGFISDGQDVTVQESDVAKK